MWEMHTMNTRTENRKVHVWKEHQRLPSTMLKKIKKYVLKLTVEKNKSKPIYNPNIFKETKAHVNSFGKHM